MLFSVIVLGLFLGMRHATDPDHVVAITTIVSRERTILDAVIIGALWGLGHTVTILTVGSGIILLKLTIPPRLGLTMELSVGCMLIFLGLLNLTGLIHRALNCLAGANISGAHVHFVLGRMMIHSHVTGAQFAIPKNGSVLDRSERFRKLGIFHVLRPLAVGFVHGLAGSAAVALFVLTTISGSRQAIGYLLIFGIGTIIGMMLITAAIALPLTFTLTHFSRLNQAFALGSGAISVCFGLFLCYQTGISEGLFTGHPVWIAR